MVAEGYDDCESDLLAHVRKVVGPDVPVGVELDLHCNIGDGTMRDATALVLFKEYPHVDVSERADDLFNVMEGAIEGRTKPVMATFDCRMIGVFHTTRQPMRGFVDKLSSMEGKDGVLSLSIAHGFPWSDIKEMSSRIIAITDDDKAKAEKLAQGARPGILRHARRDAAALRHARRGDGARPARTTCPSRWCWPTCRTMPAAGRPPNSTFILQALLDRRSRTRRSPCSGIPAR